MVPDLLPETPRERPLYCSHAVVAGILAFFALRPVKGWLRHKPRGEPPGESGQHGFLPKGLGPKAAARNPPFHVLATAHTDPSFKAAAASCELGVDTLLPVSRAANAPPTDSVLHGPTAPPQLPPSSIAAKWPSDSNAAGPQALALPPSYISTAGAAAVRSPALRAAAPQSASEQTTSRLSR